MSHVAAGDDQTEFAKALPEWLASSHILAPGDQDDTINKRRRLEEIERVLEDGPPVDLDEDLVDRSAHSRPLTAGDDDRSDAHRAASTRTRTCAAWQSLIMSIEDPGADDLHERFAQHGSANLAGDDLFDRVAHGEGEDLRRKRGREIERFCDRLTVIRYEDAFGSWGVADGFAQARDEARARLDAHDGDVSDRFRRRPRPSARVWAVP